MADEGAAPSKSYWAKQVLADCAPELLAEVKAMHLALCDMNCSTINGRHTVPCQHRQRLIAKAEDRL